MVLGDRIKALREKRDWSQTLLAKKIGISKSVMSRIESGTRPLEDSLLVMIADVLEVTTDYLLGRESKKPTISDLELSDDELISKYNVVLDGKPIEESILREILSYVRVRRSTK
jgi:transcriptional regulator with XRE-family HTH domain